MGAGWSAAALVDENRHGEGLPGHRVGGLPDHRGGGRGGHRGGARGCCHGLPVRDHRRDAGHSCSRDGPAGGYHRGGAQAGHRGGAQAGHHGELPGGRTTMPHEAGWWTMRPHPGDGNQKSGWDLGTARKKRGVARARRTCGDQPLCAVYVGNSSFYCRAKPGLRGTVVGSGRGTPREQVRTHPLSR